MCRNVNVTLLPIPVTELLFTTDPESGAQSPRRPADVLADIRARRDLVHTITEDCTKRSTRAGYDAGGMAVGVLPLADHLERLGSGTPDVSCPPTEVRAVRGGGDLLHTWGSLVERLRMDPTELVVGWECHVRQASQGDMYSEVNAHPQYEDLAAERTRVYRLTADGSLAVEARPWSAQSSIFFDTHNGDINDAAQYKVFLEREGYRFLSNSDSCVEPALRRFLYEHQCADALSGALHRLATPGADAAREPVFLRDDRRSTAAEKVAELLRVADVMGTEGATATTVSLALTARILELSGRDSKFVFQSFTPVGQAPDGFLGGGTYACVRGGSEQGGEEGGELVFHLPKPYDRRNYGIVAMLSASEESALQKQIALLDPAGLERGLHELAQPEMLPPTTLPGGIRGHATITEGVAPIFDVLPGEVLEATADGSVRVFDIYRGHRIRLVTLDGEELDEAAGTPGRRVRHERLTHLKVFEAAYEDEHGQPIPCPYDKYGEEILVIQPQALRRNTATLLTDGSDGPVRLRDGSASLGLTMGTADLALRGERIRGLRQVVTGAAGTSYLINIIAASMVRKLGLHTLPIVNLDGFTGSDTVPDYVGEETLFIANSNSGGTADTLKLVSQLAGLPAVLARLRTQAGRRAGGGAPTPDVSGIDELGTGVQEQVRAATPWIYVITNVAASPLGNIGAGLDPAILSPAGSGVTNLPEEECVGSTFAAVASLQWQMVLHTFIGETRGDITAEYASGVYAELARLPEVAEQLAADAHLAGEIQTMARELVGGNYDFVYTDYVEGVPEEQAHKAAEMIQEMFAGWQFFLFQHGKYAHMKRRTRHSLGSVLGHNAPPPSWPFFNARALKSPFEIGPRVANSFVVAHRSDRERLLGMGDYAPDFVFDYPADSVVLYPFQTVIVGHLISYYWGIARRRIGDTVAAWNRPLVSALVELPRTARALPPAARRRLETHARRVLDEFLSLSEASQWFDNMGTRRRTAIVSALAVLAGGEPAEPRRSTYRTHRMLGGERRSIEVSTTSAVPEPLDDEVYLDVVKDLAIELSSRHQAKELADHFLVEEDGRPLPRQVVVDRVRGRTRTVSEYDYLIEYEGLATSYDVESVHPPKIAKAKKGWL